MTDYPGCFGCIYNEDQNWYVTNDFTQVCHHDPQPLNLGDIRDFDVLCEFYEPEK